MQTDNIIEKARRLGLDTGNSSNMADNLRHIAEQVGINDFNSTTDLDKLEQLLDAELNEQNNVDNTEQQELDQKLSDARKEKNTNFTKKDPNDTEQWNSSNSRNRNFRETVNNKLNVAKERQDAISSKLSNAKANATKAMHPGEKLKDAAKEKVKSAAKNTGKMVGKSVTKGLKAAGNAIIKFIATTNPIILVIIGIVALILIIIFLAFVNDASKDKYSRGLFGYEYIEPKCTEITITNGQFAGTYQLEEYVAGVIQAEVGGFIGGARNEVAKAGAIAARSFVQASVTSECEIENSQARQVYTAPTDAAIQIAEETRGIVLVENNQIKLAQYDAFCTDSPQDDPDNYIICQKSQLVPREWADSQPGIDPSWKNGTRTGAHGNGMSQWGAAYLAEQGSTFKELLEYYYDKAELKSIYPSFDVTSNFTQEISLAATSTVQVQIANKPLNRLLSKTAYDELNSLISNSVMSAGVGTRAAVVASAVTPIKYLAENYGVLIPYFLSGGHGHGTRFNTAGVFDRITTSYYGIDPLWGTPGKFWYQGGGYGYISYKAYGPDCSSFVPWVFHNAGLKMSVMGASRFNVYGKKESLCGSYIAKPGDLIESSGHITVIVGVDESARQYYIAHASGGKTGVKINPFSFCGPSNYHIVNMDKFFNNPANIITNYEEVYESGVRSYQ